VPADGMTPEAMLQQAIALETEGRHRDAYRLYRRAVQEGQGQSAGQAAKRLGDMLSRGVGEVKRDYGEALRYYEIARLNGVEVQTTKAR
jgi:TPR repeat protein